ncbi:hypothetical protein [Microlunatus soli]|uniref:Secreted protein n=1 Tax=Microlunatus soli TaxID=630515 RepID=A0A1H1PV73_9ACTN|nr:hypothetical protein [Microlunatus soli]SDS14986.1 hypothetical protein SAMN04489812_1033 [Microlunatus soli]
MKMRLIAAALLSVSIVLAGCTVPGSSDKSAAKAGTIVADESSDPGHIWAMTPIGRIDFTLTEPTEKLPPYDEAYDRAAEGAKFIGVSWNWQSFTRPAPMTIKRQAPSVTFVIDKLRYNLDEVMRRKASGDLPIDLSGTAWVAVADAPERLVEADLSIEVTYDGLTQIVEPRQPAGTTDTAADALYLPPETLAKHGQTCGAARPAKGWTLGTDNCRVEVMNVPYYEPVGWASQGESWTVVTVRANPGELAHTRGYRQSITFADEAPTATYRLDDAKPVKVIPAADDPQRKGIVGDTVVFEADGTVYQDFTIDAEFRGEPGDDPAALRVTWSTTLG